MVLKRAIPFRSFLTGAGHIAGTPEGNPKGIVTVAGVPASRTVQVADRYSGIVLERQRSNADGTYRFDNLKPNHRYTVSAVDFQDQFNAVIRDNIQPVTE